MSFETPYQLMRQARSDAGLTTQALANLADVSSEQIQAFESGSEDKILISQISTAALARIARVLNLPVDCFLRSDNTFLHRMIVYQDFITPRGFAQWVKTLERYATIHKIVNEEDYASHALAKLRESIEKEATKKTVQAYRDNLISLMRAKEILGLTAHDELPKIKD